VGGSSVGNDNQGSTAARVIASSERPPQLPPIRPSQKCVPPRLDLPSTSNGGYREASISAVSRPRHRRLSRVGNAVRNMGAQVQDGVDDRGGDSADNGSASIRTSGVRGEKPLN